MIYINHAAWGWLQLAIPNQFATSRWQDISGSKLTTIDVGLNDLSKRAA
jgi:hypothetical protein